jgi:WG containing repeat
VIFVSKVYFAMCLSMTSILFFQHPSYADAKSGWMDSSGRVMEGPEGSQSFKAPLVPKGSTSVGPPGKFTVFHSKEGFGLVDESGNVVINPAPEYLFPVGEDLFARQLQGIPSGFALMDSNGKQLAFFDQRASLVGKHFSEGLITVNHGFGNTMNYCDRNGKPISEQMFVSGADFSEGLASVIIDSKEMSGGGCIDHAGRFVIGPFPKAYFSPFKDGIGIVSYSSITPEGTWVYKRGAVNKSGKFIIPANYDELSRFSKSFFLAKLGDRFELLDFFNKQVMQFPIGCKNVTASNGDSMSQLVPCAFTSNKKSDGVTGAPDPLEWGYSDMKGNLVIAARFFRCELFESGFAIASVKEDGQERVGLIDESGNWHVKPIYQALYRFANGHISYMLDEATKATKEPEVVAAPEIKGVENFFEILKSHDVIGMTLPELQKYLGEPIKSEPGTEPPRELLPASIKSLVDFYESLNGVHYGNVIQVGLDKSQKICGWRRNGRQSHGHWYTENVIFEDVPNGVQLPRPKM